MIFWKQKKRMISFMVVGVVFVIMLIVNVGHSSTTLALNSNQYTDIQTSVGLMVGPTNGGVERPVLLLVAQVVQFLLGFVGIIFFLYVLYAGFLWMTAAGNEEASAKSMKMIFQSVIGLAIILFSYALTTMIVQLVFDVQYNSLSTSQ